jgi:hypothetical protein
VEKSLQYGRANNHEETNPLSTTEYKLQGEPIFIDVQKAYFKYTKEIRSIFQQYY